MRKAFIIILIAVIVNLAVMSIGNGQTNINVSGYVPITEANSQNTQLIQGQGVTKENKYQYFFEKFNIIKENQAKIGETQAGQTIYDQIASQVLMYLLLFLAAVLIFELLKWLERHRIIYFQRHKMKK